MHIQIDALKKRSIASFNNYIQQIRFPFFKKLKKGSTINFDFPFTVLVGPNGSGKSSTLQALYGCPANHLVSKYWFSTAIDPIKESGDEAYRYIYKYKPRNYSSCVEIAQKRSPRHKSDTKKADPEYWETDRPRKKDGMDPMPPYKPKHNDIRGKTRWKKMEKNVVYIDFRAELSAFDKFFYFGTFQKRATIESPQDFLRTRSKVLNSHIQDFNNTPLTWNKRTTSSIQVLTDEELKWVNKILGKDYESAKIVTHNLFNNDGYSIIFKCHGDSYSEAVAGSGEVSVVNCVTRVLGAARDSLILLDEPEVSLHPGAQIELRNLLLHAIQINGSQVVMSTHSEHFVHGLPNNAIKLFQYEESLDSYSILNSCSPEQAFIRLGSDLHKTKTKIYVEDYLAKELVITAIQEIDPDIVDNYEVVPYPGGADTIVENLLVHFTASEITNNDLALLDGDMLKSIHPEEKEQHSDSLKEGKVVIKQFSHDIPQALHKDINDIIKEQIGRKGSSFKLPLNGGNADNKAQELKFKLKMLDIYHNKFKFMNVDTPEKFIWEMATSPTDNMLNIDAIKIKFASVPYKTRFKEVTNLLHPNKVDSKRILETQIMFLNQRDKTSPSWLCFKERLKAYLNFEDIKA
ncbi:ATP-binding protein [Aliivibrio logei]|uniref:ATP-binding protein n=1 Tax=Aliivibrio logei TaxID=688 RepID=UPI0003A00AFF|nr:ATP-binding protein [Aliivibrio logei]